MHTCSTTMSSLQSILYIIIFICIIKVVFNIYINKRRRARLINEFESYSIDSKIISKSLITDIGDKTKWAASACIVKWAASACIIKWAASACIIKSKSSSTLELHLHNLGIAKDVINIISSYKYPTNFGANNDWSCLEYIFGNVNYDYNKVNSDDNKSSKVNNSDEYNKHTSSIIKFTLPRKVSKEKWKSSILIDGNLTNIDFEFILNGGYSLRLRDGYNDVYNLKFSLNSANVDKFILLENFMTNISFNFIHIRNLFYLTHMDTEELNLIDLDANIKHVTEIKLLSSSPKRIIISIKGIEFDFFAGRVYKDLDFSITII